MCHRPQILAGRFRPLRRLARLRGMTRDATRLKIGSTSDLVLTARHALGFRPQRSVVLMCLHGERLRLGLVSRLDLPGGDDLAAFVAELCWRIDVEHPDAVAVLIFGDDAPVGDLPHRDLADALLDRLDRRVLNVVLVVGDMWWSFMCTDSCCPPQGTRIDTTSPAAVAIAAAYAMNGKSVMADRAEVVRSFEYVGDAAARSAAVSEVQAAQRRQRQLSEPQRRAAVLALVRRLGVETSDPRRRVVAGDAAELAAFCLDVPVRDAVLVRARKVRHREALRRVLAQAVCLVPPPYDAPLCATFAWVAYTAGDGITANVAVERALRTDPDYSLGHLILTALHRQVAPQQLVAAMRCAAADLKRRDLAG